MIGHGRPSDDLITALPRRTVCLSASAAAPGQQRHVSGVMHYFPSRSTRRAVTAGRRRRRTGLALRPEGSPTEAVPVAAP